MLLNLRSSQVNPWSLVWSEILELVCVAVYKHKPVSCQIIHKTTSQ